MYSSFLLLSLHLKLFKNKIIKLKLKNSFESQSRQDFSPIKSYPQYLTFFLLFCNWKMYCLSEDLHEQRGQKKSVKIQNGTRVKHPRQKLRNNVRQAREIEELKMWKAQEYGIFQLFKRNLRKDAQRNREARQDLLTSIQKSNSFKQIDQISYSENIFQSISQYLSNSTFLETGGINWSSFIQQNIGCLYKDAIQSKKKEKKIIICLNYCLQSIWNKLQSKSQTANEKQTITNFIKQIDLASHQKLEKILSNTTKLESKIEQPHKDTLVDKKLKEKLSQIEQQKQLLEFKILQLTIKLQSAKLQLKQQAEQSKERLNEQKQIGKDRLSQQMAYSREQKEVLQAELLQAKERMKIDLQETKQRFRAQLEETKQRFKAEVLNSRELLQAELERIKAQKVQAVDAKQMLGMEIAMVKAESETISTEKKNLEKLFIQKIQQYNQVIQDLLKQNYSLKKQQSSGQTPFSQTDVASKTLFHGKILSSNIAQREFLIASIQDHMNKQITNSEKLYDFRKGSNENFHQFIDGHSNLVLIVKTQCALLACYYSGVYSKDLKMQEQALIISLDNEKVYKLNNFKNYPSKEPRDKRSIQGMIYSDEFLTFGNSEVRIPIDEGIIFSNFGTSNCFFNSEGFTCGDLLNEGDTNEVEIESYQIYEIFLNDKSDKGSFDEMQPNI